MTEPSLGEVIRRFEEATNRLTSGMDDLTKELRDERKFNAETFVRKDVYASDRRGDQHRLSDIEEDVEDVKKDRESMRGFHRQVLMGGAFLAITCLVSIAIAIVNLIARS